MINQTQLSPSKPPPATPPPLIPFRGAPPKNCLSTGVPVSSSSVGLMRAPRPRRRPRSRHKAPSHLSLFIFADEPDPTLLSPMKTKFLRGRP
jgi:hypothetical protein